MKRAFINTLAPKAYHVARVVSIITSTSLRALSHTYHAMRTFLFLAVQSTLDHMIPTVLEEETGGCEHHRHQSCSPVAYIQS